jgi:hypothetical protein
MNRTLFVLAVMAALILMVASAYSQEFDPGHGNGVCNFIDEDGDGFNDLAPDADGDGIPNGLDPDYERPQDGEGLGNRYGFDGEGGLFCTSFGEDALGAMHRFGFSYGPNENSGEAMGPQDGTGFGPGNDTGGHTGDTGSGDHDSGGNGSGGNGSGGNGSGGSGS